LCATSYLLKKKNLEKTNGIMHFIGRVRSLRFMAEVSAALVTNN